MKLTAFDHVSPSCSILPFCLSYCVVTKFLLINICTCCLPGSNPMCTSPTRWRHHHAPSARRSCVPAPVPSGSIRNCSDSSVALTARRWYVRLSYIKTTPLNTNLASASLVTVRRHGHLNWLGECRDNISSRTQAPFSLCTIHVTANALN